MERTLSLGISRVLISAAIAISYFDRQTLPVAIKAIQRDIPISNTQFSQLQAAFLLGLRADVCGRRQTDRSAGHAQRLPGDHGLVVARMRQPRARRQLRDAGREPLPARAWGKAAASRRLPRPSRSGSLSASASTAMGIMNAGHGGRRGVRAAADRLSSSRR